jgi:hypothetical protein
VIRFSCPKCGQEHTAPPEAAGALGWCFCGASFPVPRPPLIIQYQPESALVARPKPEPLPLPDPEPEESDSGFMLRIKAERIQREREARFRRRLMILLAIPVVLVFVNWIAWGAACDRVKEYEEHKVNQPRPAKSGTR